MPGEVVFTLGTKRSCSDLTNSFILKELKNPTESEQLCKFYTAEGEKTSGFLVGKNHFPQLPSHYKNGLEFKFPPSCQRQPLPALVAVRGLADPAEPGPGAD